MSAGVTLRAYAKINLHLRIGQRDPATGYHALETLFQTIGLYDTLRIRPAETLRLVGSLDGTPADDSNLIVRAAVAVQRAAGSSAGARIHLTKRIPVAAGLGGGSTDAAAAIHGLDHVWNTRLSAQKLKNIAKRIGADVPFLLVGGCALGTGFGERVRLIPPPARPWWIVLVTSTSGTSTAEAYAALRARDKAKTLLASARPSAELRSLGRAWTCGDWPQATVNSFERTAFAARPRLGELGARLREAGAVSAHLSGSGPTVYGLFDSARAARAARDGLKLGRGEAGLLARPVSRSPRVVRVSP